MDAQAARLSRAQAAAVRAGGARLGYDYDHLTGRGEVYVSDRQGHDIGVIWTIADDDLFDLPQPLDEVEVRFRAWLGTDAGRAWLADASVSPTREEGSS